MSPFFITTLISVVIAVLTLGQISPSISNAIFSKNVVIGIGRESALMQQIVRYKGVEGAYPATVADLTGKGYWNATNNNNGFGGNYAFTINAAKNLVTISTTIADASRRAQYLANYRHVFKPVDIGSGVVTTTFVIPAANTISGPTQAAGSIPVSATAPSAASNTYWYDTSGAAPVLKVSDGTSWTAAGSASSGVAPPNSANIVSAVAALPSSASTGDVRYVYNSTSSSLDSYVYYNGSWVFLQPTISPIYVAFNSVGTTNWVAPAGVKQVRVLIVGGGASGRSKHNGGTFGGGGGQSTVITATVTPGASYPIVVGSGGAGWTSINPGGNSSAFGKVVSGGVIDLYSGVGAAGTYYDEFKAYGEFGYFGGGGGAGALTSNSYGYLGGIGGGGVGGGSITGTTNPPNAFANMGGGGGGGNYAFNACGSGGSGIVVIKY